MISSVICSTIVSKCRNNTNNKNNKNNMNIKNNKNNKNNNDPGNSSNLVGSGQVESWSGGVASDQSGHVVSCRVGLVQFFPSSLPNPNGNFWE